MIKKLFEALFCPTITNHKGEKVRVPFGIAAYVEQEQPSRMSRFLDRLDRLASIFWAIVMSGIVVGILVFIGVLLKEMIAS